MYWPFMLSLILAGQVVSFHVVSRLLNITKKTVPQDSDLGILVTLEKKIIKTRKNTQEKKKGTGNCSPQRLQTSLF